MHFPKYKKVPLFKGSEYASISTELKSFLYAATFVVTERMKMMKGKKTSKNEESFWKRRIKRSIKTRHKDLSKIEKIRKGNTKLKKQK